MDLDSHICYCFHVSKRKVVNFVRQTMPRKASQISECFGAGSGCGWCIPFLEKIHADIVRGTDPAREDGPDPDEYAKLREEYIQGVRTGARERNRHAREEPSGAAPAPPGRAEQPFDYTRYFSRSRPDPEPETLEE